MPGDAEPTCLPAVVCFGLIAAGAAVAVIGYWSLILWVIFSAPTQKRK